MSQWRRLSRKHRTLYLMIAVLALAATALAAGRLTPGGTATAAGEASPDCPTSAVMADDGEADPRAGHGQEG